MYWNVHPLVSPLLTIEKAVAGFELEQSGTT
jgi:hypothetical protein